MKITNKFLDSLPDLPLWRLASSILLALWLMISTDFMPSLVIQVLLFSIGIFSFILFLFLLLLKIIRATLPFEN